MLIDAGGIIPITNSFACLEVFDTDMDDVGTSADSRAKVKSMKNNAGKFFFFIL